MDKFGLIKECTLDKINNAERCLSKHIEDAEFSQALADAGAIIALIDLHNDIMITDEMNDHERK